MSAEVFAPQMPDATAGICSSPETILPASWRVRSGADGEAETQGGRAAAQSTPPSPPPHPAALATIAWPP